MEARGQKRRRAAGVRRVLLRYRDLPKITDNILDRFRIVMVHLECGSARWNYTKKEKFIQL